MTRALTHQAARVFSDRRPLAIGILGGSFNPAHSGHRHIADMAVQHLNLDALWWLVSPQNPLKPDAEMAAFSTRFSSALTEAGSCKHAKKMRVSNLEIGFNVTQTATTLHYIKKHAAKARFIWLMGADNLASFHTWHRPRQIAKTMAIAVIDRPAATAKALASAGGRIAGRRVKPRRLAARKFPKGQWCFIQGRLNKQSSSALRQQYR